MREDKVLAFDYCDASARLQMAQRRAIQKVPGLDWAGRSAAEIMPPTSPTEVSFRRAPIELSDSGLSHDRDWGRQKRPVSRDDLAVKKDQLARRMSGDRFGDTARGDGE